MKGDKRGQSSTIGVTIAIVLGITLIIFLIWGFSTNFSMFSNTGGSFTGKTNLDTVQQACQIQFDNAQKNEFCLVEKGITLPNGEKVTASCNRLVSDLQSGNDIYKITISGNVNEFCSGVVTDPNAPDFLPSN
ncbi:MAG: hypothetical protein ACI83O_000450 [Patescibacteria group bacterium]|jgi:hypothetical protein